MWFKKDYNVKLREEWITREQIGFFLFTRVNLLETKFKIKILKMLKDFFNLIRPHNLNLLRYGVDAYSYKDYTSDDFEDFSKHFKNFKYRYDPDNEIFNIYYEIDFKKDCGHRNTIGDVRFYIHINGSINYNKSIYASGNGCHEIAIFIPKDFSKIENQINFIKKYFSALKCCYGYINPVISYNKVQTLKISEMLTKYISGNPNIYDIPDNLSNSMHLLTKVKGAYWGNFISQKHIGQLGGAERIKRKLKEFVIEELPSNNLFIKMPFNVPLKKNHNIIDYYRKLAEFFAPIFISKWNQYDVGLQLKGDKFLRRFL